MNTEVQLYLDTLEADRREVITNLIELFKQHLPVGFELCIQYKIPSFVVPLSTYPDGYHCNPEEPLPFIGIASQKSHIAIYHMGLYAMEDLKKQFINEAEQEMGKKLDMGKSCIRLKGKKIVVPYKSLEHIAKKISINDWISTYNRLLKK